MYIGLSSMPHLEYPYLIDMTTYLSILKFRTKNFLTWLSMKTGNRFVTNAGFKNIINYFVSLNFILTVSYNLQ